MIQLNQIPPMDEVWKVGSIYYVVRYVDGTNPPIPLVWEVRGEDVEALGIEKVTRTLSTTEFRRTGAVDSGSSRELLNVEEDPIDQINSNYEKEALVKPWLRDPEMLALWFGAALEGRSITDAEMQASDWWRTHSESERQWLALNASDPATAATLVADNRAQVSQLVQSAGVDNASPELINLIADNWTTGSWTQLYATNQIRLLADPNLEGTLDPALTQYRKGLDTTLEGTDTVRDLVKTWLGPAYSNWSDEQISQWATQLRENPDAKVELEAMLRNHRLALFPEYKDANLTYEDIASPWRGLFRQEWGQMADETDPLFARVVRMNDLAGATQMLRQEGLKRNNSTVSQNLLSDIGSAFGSNVRPADSAIM